MLHNMNGQPEQRDKPLVRFHCQFLEMDIAIAKLIVSQ